MLQSLGGLNNAQTKKEEVQGDDDDCNDGDDEDNDDDIIHATLRAISLNSCYFIIVHLEWTERRGGIGKECTTTERKTGQI